MPAGRPPLFTDPNKLLELCNKYFKWCDDNPWIKTDAIRGGDNAGTLIYIPTARPYTLIAMCQHLDINTDTWYDYEKKDVFSAITKHVHDKIRNQKFEGAAVGAFNANIIARDLGLSDNQKVTLHTEQPIYPPIKD